jgi:hypothetical protein
VLWPTATTAYLRRTGGVPAAGWRRANSWWTHIYWESTNAGQQLENRIFQIHNLKVVNAVFLCRGGVAHERRRRGYSPSSSSSAKAEAAVRRVAISPLETARRSRATTPQRTSWRNSKTSSALAAAGPAGEGAAAERRVRTASAVAAA